MRVFTSFLFVVFAANFEFAGFRKQKKYTAYDRFHRNDPSGEIPPKKEPIRTLGFTSNLSCHIIIEGYCLLNNIIIKQQSLLPVKLVFSQTVVTNSCKSSDVFCTWGYCYNIKGNSSLLDHLSDLMGLASTYECMLRDTRSCVYCKPCNQHLDPWPEHELRLSDPESSMQTLRWLDRIFEWRYRSTLID